MHSGNHKFKEPNKNINNQGFNFKNITVEVDVWIAARCTILSGVNIGKGSVIAAGSVITKDIQPYSVVAGVPGKIIAKRK
ncbi:DapH/DapD/GlmU-related protein [Namhaeicola litoreus]|uniref:DapH/DapD/GlmU-related protein n=1 Tax=Namhaeicola litoreus TaxID=1052145 RepID=A0ABW3Y4C8_9FLAO